MVKAEPSLFCVGGVQSRVAVPVETILTGGVVVPEATVVEPDVVVVESAGGVVVAVDGGVVVWVVPVERSITPTLGETSGSELTVEAVEVLVLPSGSQPARPNAARVHKMAPPICERAAKTKFSMTTTPVTFNSRQGSDASRAYDLTESAAAI